MQIKWSHYQLVFHCEYTDNEMPYSNNSIGLILLVVIAFYLPTTREFDVTFNVTSFTVIVPHGIWWTVAAMRVAARGAVVESLAIHGVTKYNVLVFATLKTRLVLHGSVDWIMLWKFI